METVYTKRFIKSIDDLPKESGKYIVHLSKNDEVYSVHLETVISQWELIDWFLELRELPTDEDVFNAFEQDFKTFADKMKGIISEQEMLSYKGIELNAWMKCATWFRDKIK